jgi:hypothetical protein
LIYIFLYETEQRCKELNACNKVVLQINNDILVWSLNRQIAGLKLDFTSIGNQFQRVLKEWMQFWDSYKSIQIVFLFERIFNSLE